MVINKNSKNKRSSYLKYVREIIKSLEENQETWRMIVCGNSNKKTRICLRKSISFMILVNHLLEFWVLRTHHFSKTRVSKQKFQKMNFTIIL